MARTPTALARHVDRLAGQDRWTYQASRHTTAEPAAWSSIALLAHGRREAAAHPAAWLEDLQKSDGSVPVSPPNGDAHDDTEPRWPTALALFAWSGWDRDAELPRFAESTALAAQWAIDNHGETAPRSPEVGHDTTLLGWSWAAATHSWLEPSAMFVLGLRSAGFGEHARTREGVRLLVDRLLPDGGANYGNTLVFGQALLPHIQPTGLAMLALAGEAVDDPRIEKSLSLLERALNPTLATDSFSYALMALTAHGRRPADADDWVLAKLNGPDGPLLAAYDRALLLAAALAEPGALNGVRKGGVT